MHSEGIDTKNQPLDTMQAMPKPPVLPQGYVALNEPRPLIGIHDDLWVVLADYGDTGLLIYEQHRCVAFLISEECITMLYTLMEHTQKFLDLCQPEYLENPVHQSGLATVRAWLKWKAS